MSMYQQLCRKLLIPRFVLKDIKLNYCSKDKKPPETPPETSKETDTDKPEVAPKVIAKHPPIEEVTHGQMKLSDLKKREEKHKDEVKKELDALLYGDNIDQGAAPPPDAPRLTRTEPGKTFFCLIPAEWVKAFNNKTGVTGFWTFAFTYGTYLISKEKIIMEHEYYNGLGHILMWCLAVKFVGPHISQSIDKKVDQVLENFNKEREKEIAVLEANIAHEEELQLSSEAQLVVVEAKRENVHLQLEAEYRKRIATVHSRVENILKYQVETEELKRSYAQRHMVEWVIKEVHKALNDDIQAKYMEQCVQELDAIATRRKQ